MRGFQPQKHVVLTVTLRRAAAIIGTVLGVVCFAMPYFTPPVLTMFARMLTGFYGALFIIVALFGTEANAGKTPHRRG